MESSIQYVDGTNILNINRDDATGFRLDTLTICKQYATPTVEGKEMLTTRTDNVSKHPSVIQTTSYNFTRTATTAEKCVGVVKAYPIHQKNPAQHISDLHFLSEHSLFTSVFKNPVTHQNKLIVSVLMVLRMKVQTIQQSSIGRQNGTLLKQKLLH